MPKATSSYYSLDPSFRNNTLPDAEHPALLEALKD